MMSRTLAHTRRISRTDYTMKTYRVLIYLQNGDELIWHMLAVSKEEAHLNATRVFRDAEMIIVTQD